MQHVIKALLLVILILHNNAVIIRYCYETLRRESEKDKVWNTCVYLYECLCNRLSCLFAHMDSPLVLRIWPGVTQHRYKILFLLASLSRITVSLTTRALIITPGGVSFNFLLK